MIDRNSNTNRDERNHNKYNNRKMEFKMNRKAVVWQFIDTGEFDGIDWCSYWSYIILPKVSNKLGEKYDLEGECENIPINRIQLLILIEAIEDVLKKGYLEMEIITTKYLAEIYEELKDNSNSEDWIVSSKYKENSDLIEKIQRFVTDKNYNIDVICLLYR
jgi:hypothetical protein